MEPEPKLSPVVLEMSMLAAAVASRCPSKTHELLASLRRRGVPEGQITAVVEEAVRISTETVARGSEMVEAVLGGESPRSCMERMARQGGASECCASDDDCRSRSSCC